MDVETYDYLVAQLHATHRPDLVRMVPPYGAGMSRTAQLFWQDVEARFHRGEPLDAVTAIERRFFPRVGHRPEDNNAYHFVEPV